MKKNVKYLIYASTFLLPLVAGTQFFAAIISGRKHLWCEFGIALSTFIFLMMCWITVVLVYKIESRFDILEKLIENKFNNDIKKENALDKSKTDL